MAKALSHETQTVPLNLPQLKPNVAGVDVGAEEIYVAIHQGQDHYDVRHFPTFTQDLRAKIRFSARLGCTLQEFCYPT